MKRYFIMLLMLVTLSCPLTGQDFVPAEVTISEEIVRFADGSMMYVHKVLPRQTLFSIAKAYGFKVEEILRHNPQIDSSGAVSVGELIYIPVSEKSVYHEENMDKSDDRSRKALFPGTDGNGITENVKKKKKATEKDSSAYTAPETETETETKYRVHKVKWYEDIESIARKYDVSVEAIVHLNRLPDTRLKSRMKIMIPDNDYSFRDTYEVQGTAASADEGQVELKVPDDTVPSAMPEISGTEETEGSGTGYGRKIPVNDRNRMYKVSLILPVNASLGRHNANGNYLDFYSGVLMAVNDMKQEGMRITLQVIDTGDYGSISDITSSGVIDGSDFVIGPPLATQLAPVAEYCRKKRIPVVSPLDNNAEKLAYDNPYFIQAVPSNDRIKENILDNFIAAEGCSSRLFVYENAYRFSTSTMKMKARLDSMGVKYNEISYDILEGRTILPKLTGLLSKEGKTKVLVASENQAFVSEVMRNLELAYIKGYRISLLGLPKWKNYESIDVALYHSLELNLSVPYNTDYGSNSIDYFVRKYRTLFNMDPNNFAFQGYDVSYFMLRVLYDFDDMFFTGIEKARGTMLQSNMKFEKTERGGYVNIMSKTLQYLNDYSIEEVK